MVGAPDMSAAMRDRVAATAPGWTLRTPDTTAVELQRVTASYGDPAPAALGGARATESAVRARMPPSRVIHIAAPFRMNSASPLFSSVLVAPDPAATGTVVADNDAALEAREVVNLDLRATAVVVSDGAAASMRDGAAASEAVQWAWRAAGVPSLVLPRWTVDGGAPAELLGELHRRLHAGESPANALQAARALLRAREETRAPYFWAGWIVIGPR
jgi:CHAT domain-containing protein